MLEYKIHFIPPLSLTFHPSEHNLSVPFDIIYIFLIFEHKYFWKISIFSFPLNTRIILLYSIFFSFSHQMDSSCYEVVWFERWYGIEIRNRVKIYLINLKIEYQYWFSLCYCIMFMIHNLKQVINNYFRSKSTYSLKTRKVLENFAYQNPFPSGDINVFLYYIILFFILYIGDSSKIIWWVVRFWFCNSPIWYNFWKLVIFSYLTRSFRKTANTEVQKKRSNWC